MSPSRSLPFLCAGVLLAAAAGARAELATKSPFLPPQGAQSSAPTADAPLEFRGIADLPGGPAFRVVDPARKMGVWVHLNERDPDLGITVKQADAAHDTVTVEHQGRTITLALRQSKVSSSGAAMPNAIVGAPQLQMQMQAATIAQQAPAAPVQQAQLDAVAAAVAQRRALREQATQQISQGVPIAPQVIQQQQQQRAQNAANQAQNGPNVQGGQTNQRGQQRRNR